MLFSLDDFCNILVAFNLHKITFCQSFAALAIKQMMRDSKRAVLKHSFIV